MTTLDSTNHISINLKNIERLTFMVWCTKSLSNSNLLSTNTSYFFHLLFKLRTNFYVYLMDGTAGIFFYLSCHNQESHSRQFSCTSMKDLILGHFTN